MAKFIRIKNAIIDVEKIFHCYVQANDEQKIKEGYTHCLTATSTRGEHIGINFRSEEEAFGYFKKIQDMS